MADAESYSYKRINYHAWMTEGFFVAGVLCNAEQAGMCISFPTNTWDWAAGFTCLAGYLISL